MAETIITLEEAKKYARKENNDEDDVFESLILFAEGIIKGGLGDDFPREDPRIKLLAKCIVSEKYDNREVTVSGNKVSNSMQRLCSDVFQQIRMEMRSKK